MTMSIKSNQTVSFTSFEIRWAEKVQGKFETLKRLRLNGRVEAFIGEGFDDPVELSHEQYQASLKTLGKALADAQERIQRMLAGRETLECPFEGAKSAYDGETVHPEQEIVEDIV